MHKNPLKKKDKKENNATLYKMERKPKKKKSRTMQW